MVELKTKKNHLSVAKYIANLSDAEAKKDAKTLLSVMQDISKEKGSMWGEGIVGFGDIKYRLSSGKENEWFNIGFSMRKSGPTLYLCGAMYNFEEYSDLLEKMGPHKTGKGCLYIKRLSDVKVPVLKQLINKAFREMKKVSSK